MAVKGTPIKDQEMVARIKTLLMDPDDLIVRDIKLNKHMAIIQIIYFKELIDSQSLSEYLLNPLLQNADLALLNQDDLFKEIPIGELKPVEHFEQAIELLGNGFALIINEKRNIRLAANIASVNQRSIEEPKSEKVIRGSHIGFVENLDTNFALIRKQLHQQDLRIVAETISGCNKKVYLVYLEQTADHNVIKALKKRLSKVKLREIDHIRNLEEWILDKGLSPFPNLLYTERPDRVSSSLIGGKIALFISESPDVGLLPISIADFIKTMDDYSENSILVSFIRFMRIFSVLLAFNLSSLYIAMTYINHELIPYNAILSIIQGREGVPFPIWVEVLILEVILEMVIEALQRMPENIGSTITLMGTLVIGQAVVQAGILDTTIIVVIALEAIASFVVPVYNVSISIRLLRLPMIFFAYLFGVNGIIWYNTLIIIHLARKENFGYPYLTPFSPVYFKGWKDNIFRLPKRWMQNKPITNE